MNIKILDTGYIANLSLVGQTQLGLSDRAGYNGTTSVNGFTLKTGSNLRIGGDVKLEDKPITDKLTDVITTTVSANSRIINVVVIIQKNDSTAGYEFNQLTQLARLERTRGLKLLYPSVLTDVNKTFVEVLGEENVGGVFSEASPTDTEGTVSITTPYLVGRVRNFAIVDDVNGNYWRITFDFVLSG